MLSCSITQAPTRQSVQQFVQLLSLSLSHSLLLSLTLPFPLPYSTWKLLRLSCATCPTMAESFCCSSFVVVVVVVLQPKGYKSSTMHMLPEHLQLRSSPALPCPGLLLLASCAVRAEMKNQIEQLIMARRGERNGMDWHGQKNGMKWNGMKHVEQAQSEVTLYSKKKI